MQTFFWEKSKHTKHSKPHFLIEQYNSKKKKQQKTTEVETTVIAASW